MTFRLSNRHTLTRSSLVAALVLALAATTVAAASAQTEAQESPRGYDIAFIAGQVGIPFYTTMECGAQDAAQHYGVNLTWQGPPQWDLALQLPMIQAALENQPDAMALAPTDPVALIETV